MRILYVAHRFPYPPNKGDKIRTYNFVRELAYKHDVHLATLVDNRNDLEHLPQLSEGLASVSFAMNDGSLSKLWAARAIAYRLPISVLHFYRRALQRKVDEIIEKVRPQAIVCASSPTLAYLNWSRFRQFCFGSDVVKVMDLIDVDSLKWRQYAGRASFPHRQIYHYEARTLRHFEQQAYGRFNHLLLVSEQERALFPGGDPEQKVHAVPNGVDLDFFSPLEQDPEPETLVFTGMMDYLPNIEGMRWFIHDVLPIIREQRPNTEVLVVGGRPVKEVVGWGSKPGITVTGFVDDIRTYVARGSVCIAPLRIARGIQNKVLEAMAMAKAVVCTADALEGIGATAGEHALVADDAQAFAQATLELLDDVDRRRRLGLRARTLMEAEFTWSRHVDRIEVLLSNTGTASLGH